MFSSWWSKGSSSFSCDSGPEVKLNGLVLGAGSFTQLFSGTQKNPEKSPVSIFVTSDINLGSAAVKKLKTLRHPCVINFVDSQETEKAVLCATEPVEPLLMHLNEDLDHRDQYLAWGIFQIFRGVSFLHEANLIHGSLHCGSIFVNQSGDWKLFGFEQMRSTQNSASEVKGSFPALSKFLPPEAKNNPYSEPSKAQDLWGLGCIIWEVYNGNLSSSNDLARIGSIPKLLSPIYMEMVAANPSNRPNPKDKLKSPFFKNDIIETLTFLEELQIKDDQDKSRFFTNLPGKLDRIPIRICQQKILAELIKAFDFSNAGSLILAPVFKIGKNLSTEEYQAKIIPCIVKLFSSPDRNARFKLLSQIESFVEHLSPKVVNNDVFPQLQNGFLDKEPIIREKTVIAMIHLAEKLNSANLDEVVVMKHFSRLLRDEQPGIRTNTAVCLGKIARYLHYSTRQKVLIPAFGGKLKDPFPPARIAAINALAATQQYYTVLETSSKVVPMLCPAMADPEKPVREQAFKVIKGFMEKLEQVSNNPELKEEMEREVMSTNSQVLTQAASWANWAVGAIGAKFYKSANKPPEAMSSSSSREAASAVTNKTNVSANKAVTPPDVKKQQKEPINLMNFEPNEQSSEEDGWKDDDADWGSLDDALDDKKDETSNANSMNDFESWSRDSAPSKVHDKTAIVKQGIQTLQLDEWDSWNDASNNSDKTDDKKKEREEKRLQRQREIEAKRAARKGPLKLGAKKSATDDLL